MKSTNVLKMIFLLIATAKGMDENCIWSNITFHGGAVKAVNSTATIRVWSEGLNPKNRDLLLWQIVQNVGHKDGVVKAEYNKTGEVIKIDVEEGNGRGNASFTFNDHKMSSNLTLILQASDNSLQLEIYDGRCPGDSKILGFEMVVEFCNATEEISAYGQSDATILINLTDSPVYEAIGVCYCQDGHLFNVTGVPADGRVQCNDTAQWVGCEDVQCWFAPSNITISQKPEYADQKANFDCDFSEGFPENASVSYFIGSTSVAIDEILKSKYNGEQYHCEVANNYTKSETTTNKTVVSPSKELEVYFPPENLTYSTNATNAEGKIHIKINASANVNFTFHANDANGSVIAIFRQMNQSGSDPIPSSQNNTENDEYNFQYSLEINDTDDYGFYIFNVSTTDPLDFVNITIEIVPYEIVSKTTVPTYVQTTLPDDPKIIYIAVGCSVAVVLIIALVVFLIVYRRRKEKSAADKDIKEERENPLYGSAPGPSINAEYATVDKSKKKQEKEEKVNPIYQGTSAGADADTVEEAYAAIDIKKKKKKKEKNSEGSENSAFDPEATYAAVNKPKKKKNVEPPPDVVYSAVQKKKKNDQPADTDLHV